MILLALTLLASAEGPISKFEGKAPDAEYVSGRPLGEVERCLIDLDGYPAPNVYRQPDRPNEVTLLWLVDNRARDRVDLSAEGSGTKIKSWIGSKQIRGCAP